MGQVHGALFFIRGRKKKLIDGIEIIVNGTRGEVDREVCSTWNEFRICEQFHCLPRSGGYEAQSPKAMEAFKIINQVIAEAAKRRERADKLAGMQV